MSDTCLTLLPTEPSWLPDSQQEAHAADVITRLIPTARDDQLQVVRTAGIELIDAGENFEAIRCPQCGRDLDMSWWHGEMDRQYSRDNGFELQPITVPCCGGTTGLNDLVYEWPQGFARWSARAFNPGRGWLDHDELNEIGQALGHPVCQVIRYP
jgi:hypothetical protein